MIRKFQSWLYNSLACRFLGGISAHVYLDPPMWSLSFARDKQFSVVDFEFGPLRVRFDRKWRDYSWEYNEWYGWTCKGLIAPAVLDPAIAEATRNGRY